MEKGKVIDRRRVEEEKKNNLKMHKTNEISNCWWKTQHKKNDFNISSIKMLIKYSEEFSLIFLLFLEKECYAVSKVKLLKKSESK